MKRRRTRGKNAGPNGAGADQSARSAADFSFALCRLAISQICRSVGFRSAESSALETLTLIATKHLRATAGVAASLSNAANRTESNLFDVVNALHDLCLPIGFPGGSAVDSNCLIRSGVLKDLSDFMNTAPEIPFAKPVPRRNEETVERVVAVREEDAPPRGRHIPGWLPALPDESALAERNERMGSEELWEKSDGVGENFGKVPEFDGEKRKCGGGCLAQKRERVRFKLGGERGKREVLDTASEQ